MSTNPPQIVDIRDRLPTRPLKVPVRDLTDVDRLVIHVDHRRRTAGDDDLTVLAGHAQYHIDKNWGQPGEPPIHGDGLMYHLAVTPHRIYQTRDFTHAVWHARGANGRGLAVMVFGAFGQDVAPEQYALLSLLLPHLYELPELPNLVGRHQVYGHGELTQHGNATECPGGHLRTWIRRYRDY